MFRYSKHCSCAFRQNFPAVLMQIGWKQTKLITRLKINMERNQGCLVPIIFVSFHGRWLFVPFAVNLPGSNLRLNRPRSRRCRLSCKCQYTWQDCDGPVGRRRGVGPVVIRFLVSQVTPPGNDHILLMVQKSRRSPIDIVNIPFICRVSYTC